ncbi:DUF222 domain-containing protein [Allokutzneria albata]|uniref:DUF222 domain-containing protein n=1 Tax=Allokutzneria albata TaxID=211114 RepID=UPI0004C40632|nr:DUF222 domain-containing protein [Allokutzneria albata]
MLDTKAIRVMLADQLVADDSYRLSEADHVEFLQELERIGNLLTAAKIDAARQAEERGLHTRHGCKGLSILLRTKLNLNQAEAKRRTRLVHELPSLPHTQDGVYSGVIRPGLKT